MNELDIWTIYQRPRDYPDGYVVRRSVVGAGAVAMDAVAQYAPDLLGARAMVPLGKARMSRFDNDDPAILEVWL